MGLVCAFALASCGVHGSIAIPAKRIPTTPTRTICKTIVYTTTCTKNGHVVSVTVTGSGKAVGSRATIPGVQLPTKIIYEGTIPPASNRPGITPWVGPSLLLTKTLSNGQWPVSGPFIHRSVAIRFCGSLYDPALHRVTSETCKPAGSG
jgi:hypothetical protein